MDVLNSLVLGRGEPLLILHGFLGMCDNWKTLGVQYAEAGFEVHLLDHRNHGRSFHSDVFNYTVMAEDVLVYADAHHLDKFSIIGHSMGGKVAMFFAVNHSNRLHKLIVADIAPRYYPPHHQDILSGLSALYQTKITRRHEADDMLSKYIASKTLRMFLLKNLYRKQDAEAYEFRINFPVILRDADAIGEALEGGCYKGETLFLRGGASDYIREEDIVMIKEMFLRSEFATIAHASHWLHAEKPKEFMDISLSYLK